MTTLLTSLSRQIAFNPPAIQTLDPRYGLAAAAATANSVYLGPLPRLVASVLATGVEIYVGGSSGNVDVGLFSFDGTTFTLLRSSGSTATTPTNDFQAVPFTATYLIPRYNGALDYYVGVCPDNAVVTIGRAGGVGNANKRGNQAMIKASAFPLATNGTSIAGATGTAAAVWARVY